MKTLQLAVDISHMAMQRIRPATSSAELLNQTREILENKANELGAYQTCNRIAQEKQDDILVEEYKLAYEFKTLSFRLLYFRPRNAWQIQDFQIENA